MSPISIIVGTLLAAIGIVAVVTGEFHAASGWVFAGGLALLGVAGLISVLRT